MSRFITAFSRKSADRRGSWKLGLLFVGILATLLLPGPARAEDAVGQVPALKLAPQDASFFQAMLRNREQVEIVAKSNFWKKVQQMPFYKEALANYQKAIGQPGPAAQFLPVLELPENQQAISVLKEMVSDEMFVYGSADFSDALRVTTDVSNAINFAGFTRQLVGNREMNEDEVLGRVVLDSLNRNLEDIKVPDLVMGFRIKSQEPAEEQMRRLQAWIMVALEQAPLPPAWRKQFKSRKIGDGQYMLMTIDSTQIPWDEVPFERFAEKPGQYDKLRDKLKSLQVVIALGIQKGYVILSVGKSTQHLAALGAGATLADHPRLQMFRDAGAKKFTMMAFVSDRFAQFSRTEAHQIDQGLSVVEKILAMPSKLSDDEKKQILADVHMVGTELKARLPKPQAQLAYTYLTPNGLEGVQADWTEASFLDGSQPLPILEHLGSSPLLAVASRIRYRQQDHDFLVTGLVKGKNYFEKYALPQMPEYKRAQYKQYSEIIYPALSRMDVINQTLLKPALADGQFALVVDTTATKPSTRWMEEMPETAEPTALPMPALVLGVSDQAKLEEALTEYRSIANDLIKKLRPLVAPTVPEFELGPAKSRPTGAGETVYYYPVPKDNGKALWGLDKQLAPNAGVSAKVFVLSISPQLTTQLLKAQPPKAAAEGPLSGPSRPLAAGAIFDWPQLVDAVVPWIVHGVRSAGNRAGALEVENDDAKPGDHGDTALTKSIISQVKEGAELLKAFKGVTAASQLEGGARITHSQARFEDVP